MLSDASPDRLAIVKFQESADRETSGVRRLAAAVCGRSLLRPLRTLAVGETSKTRIMMLLARLYASRRFNMPSMPLCIFPLKAMAINGSSALTTT